MIPHWKNIETPIIEGEEWLPLNINNNFKISSFGRITELGVFRKLYRTNKGGKGNGYVITQINANRQLVHRLVASHFVENPNPSNFVMVNHKDGDKTNNYYKNLEWCNNSMNVQHAFDTGLRISSKGEKNGAATIDDSKAKAIIRIIATSSLSNREAAKYFGMPYSTFRKVKDGTHWGHLNSYRNIFL